jgi:hypothetical protein
MAWTIAAGPIPIETPRDADSWRWDIQRGTDRRSVIVHVAGTAMASGDLLPEDTRRAIETEGGSEVEAVIKNDEPPHEILCTTGGCKPV